MSRRFSLAVAAVSLAGATLAHGSSAERACSPDGVTHLVPARDEIAALFARPEQQAIETPTGTAYPAGPAEVLVARIGEDGKVVIACVDNEAAARRFLDAAPDTITRKKEK
ncbi:MAG TPA: hypothetical protein VJZ00_02975 [Thermoanaerobaculia bacterium]|nr:hypothetical protein [Thermoanaerobaculia bacterium]